MLSVKYKYPEKIDKTKGTQYNGSLGMNCLMKQYLSRDWGNKRGRYGHMDWFVSPKKYVEVMNHSTWECEPYLEVNSLLMWSNEHELIRMRLTPISFLRRTEDNDTRASMPCGNGGRYWDIAAASQGNPTITIS